MAKPSKQTKKFQKNHLKRAIDDRRNHQKKKAQIDRAKKAKDIRAAKSRGGADPRTQDQDSEDDDEDEDLDEDDVEAGNDAESSSAPFKGMSVEDFLGGGYKAGMDDDDDEEDEDVEEDDDDDMSEIEDLSEDEGHAQDLEKLKEKDPEFYKYLQENDQELLRFGGGDSDDDDLEDEDAEMEEDDDDEEISASDIKGKGKADEGTQTVVTAKLLRSWQKAMVQHHSLKALRKLLLAFRAAAHMNDPDEAESPAHAFVVEEASVFNKLVMTTLKYTPVVLQHHIPAKETAQGKFKLPTNNKKFALLQRPIQTYFSNLHHLLKTIPEAKTLYVAVTESAKMVPFVMNNRRMAREYAKTMLELWSTAADNVRIAAFLSLRKIAKAGDEAMLDFCLRGVYHSFIRSTKLTTVHTLPSINLMKNSGSELYSLDSSAAYQQAFSFIRQLAIHLRNALKTKSADAFKSVYNWQYLHCVDFWSLVLSTACDKTKTEVHGENELQQLIYPLVQVATGAIKLIPTSRYFPLRMHLLRSILRLMQRTGVYIPLGSFLLEMLAAPEFMRKAKGSTLKPLEFITTLRAPASYVRTRVYADQLAEEVPHLLLEYLGTQSRSIAFPELVVPLTAQLKRTLKHGTSQKLSATCKQLLAKMESNSKWITNKRNNVDFAPNNVRGVQNFLSDLDEKAETPLESALRLARKVRDQRRQVVEMEEQQV